MAVVTGRYLVEPAPTDGGAIRYGLFTVVPPRDISGDLIHARDGGVQYETATCAGGHGLAVTCDSSTSKTFDAPFTLVTGDPFVVYTSAVCAPVGLTEARARHLLLDRMRGGEQGAVESVFSTQANGQAPGLANNGSVVTLTAATTVTAAVSQLEQFLYQTSGYGFPGIIHAPSVAAAWFHNNTEIKEGADGIFRTPQGTMISFGNYSGNVPGGGAPAAGHTTLYITGRMAIWRDREEDILMPPYGQTLNRSTNQISLLAERTYVVTFDCFVAGVDTTLAP